MGKERAVVVLTGVWREYVSLGQKDLYITPSHSWPARQNAAESIDMHSKFILLLLAALQVACCCEWERPHIKYYSRWAKHQPDVVEHGSSDSEYEDSDHKPSRCRWVHHSDDIKPIHEDQHEGPRRSDSFLKEEVSHHCFEEGNDVHVGRLKPGCEICVNPIRPPYHESKPCDEILVNPVCPPYHEPKPCDEICVNPIHPPYHGPKPCDEILVNPIRPPYHEPKPCDEICVNPIHPPYHEPKPCDEICVNPIRPPYHQPKPCVEICVNPIRPPYHEPKPCDEICVNPIRPPYHEPKPCDEICVNHICPPYHEPKPGCEIFVNPIRPPYHQPREGDSENLDDRDIQASIANSAINQQIAAAGLRAPIPEIALTPAPAPIAITPLLPFLPSGFNLPINSIGPSAAPFLPAPPLSPTAILPPPPVLSPPILPSPPILSPPILPHPTFCIRHRLVPVPVQVVEECITDVPVVRKTLCHQVQTLTRHVPVIDKTVFQQQEKIVRHVPVSGKTTRNVVETRVRHIPVIRSRTRTIVEPYTVHVPVTIRFTRPVEESITKTVPVQEVRTKPVLTQRTRLVPVVERRLRPVVENRIDNVPVKRKYVRTIVEQRVRPVVGPCYPCNLVPLPGWGLNSQIPAEEIPQILSSPFSDIIGPSGGAVTAPVGASDGAINAQFGLTNSPLEGLQQGNIIISPVNGQISARKHCGPPYGLPGHDNSGTPCAPQIIPFCHHHPPTC